MYVCIVSLSLSLLYLYIYIHMCIYVLTSMCKCIYETSLWLLRSFSCISSMLSIAL